MMSSDALKNPPQKVSLVKPDVPRISDYLKERWSDYYPEAEILRCLSHLCILTLRQKAKGSILKSLWVGKINLCFTDPYAPLLVERNGRMVHNYRAKSYYPPDIAGVPSHQGLVRMHIHYRKTLLYQLTYHHKPKKGCCYLHASHTGLIMILSAQEKWELLHKNESVMQEPDEVEVDPSSLTVYKGSGKVIKAPHEDSEDKTSFQEMKIFRRHMDSTFSSVEEWTSVKRSLTYKNKHYLGL